MTLTFLACGLQAQEYRFRFFGASDGLTNLGVRQIFEDRVGFLWVGTENGVFRYDGDRFEAFGASRGLPSNSGVAFGEAPDGSLLVGGNIGLYRLSGDRFEKIPIPAGSVSWAQGIQRSPTGSTLVGTDSGLVEIGSPQGGGRFAVTLMARIPGTSGPEASGILVDGSTIWYGCGLELCRVDANGVKVFGRESGLPDRVWLSIRKDSDGAIWVRGMNEGVFVLPRAGLRFRRPDSPVPARSLGMLATDDEGRILAPSAAALLIHGRKGWRTVDRKAGLRGTIYAAFEDRRHALWVGLAGRGLARWQGFREWESYTTDSGLASDVVYEILPLPDGSIWVATEAGLVRGFRLDGGGIQWSKVSGVAGVPTHSVRLGPGGDIWIGTETHGAARIDRRTGAVEWFGIREGLAAKAPYVLRFDRKQRLWAATEVGLFVARAPYRTFARIGEVPSMRVWTVAEGKDGTIWAGGAGGLFEEDAAGHWNQYSTADGLSNREVISLGADNSGRMWVGYRYGGGIDRVRSTTGRLAVEKGVQRIGTDGIAYFLEPDASGWIWVGTEKGVDVWEGSRWNHYDAADGLVWDDCDLGAFAFEPDGTVWIGTSAGLARFSPRARPAMESAPRVLFTKVALGRTDVAGRFNPAVDIHSNYLTARYSVLNVPTEGRMLFRYRLMPVKSAWAETTQRELEFPELPSGNYRLELEAGGKDGSWSGAQAAFPFVIRSPWYRTWWFSGVCVIAPLLTAAGALRMRIRNARRRERRLVMLVEEKTVDLRRANEDLLRLSSLDPLTGLANRRIFNHTLDKELAGIDLGHRGVSLVIADVDHFKALNDALGHQRGDECLILLGQALRRSMRSQADIAARYGGEEFAVVLPDAMGDDAASLAEALRSSIAALRIPHPASPLAPFVTVSVGVATATQERFRSPEDLIAAADSALYRAKRNGRNRVEMALDSKQAGPEVNLERGVR